MIALWHWVCGLRYFLSERNTYQTLLALPDERLDDIGLTREEIIEKAKNYGIEVDEHSTSVLPNRRKWRPWNTQA